MSTCPRLLTVSQVLTLGLATWRLSRMVTMEHGPGGVFTRLRRLAGAHFDPTSRTWYGKTSLAELATCSLCLSVWIGTGLVLSVRRFPILWPFVDGMAVSAAAVLAHFASDVHRSHG